MQLGAEGEGGVPETGFGGVGEVGTGVGEEDEGHFDFFGRDVEGLIVWMEGDELG